MMTSPANSAAPNSRNIRSMTTRTHKTYAKEQHQAIIEAYRRGDDVDCVARSIGMNPHTASTIIRQFERTGKVGQKQRGRRPTKFDVPRCVDFLLEYLSDGNNADVTLNEMRSLLAMAAPAGLGTEPPPSQATIAL